jgi:hypothetical protein
MPVTAIILLVIVTAQVAILSPAFAIMTAVPSFTAVTLPLLSTVVISVLFDVQSIVLSVALSGVTVAIRVAFSPSFSASEVLSSVIPVTATVFDITVTVHVAVFCPTLAAGGFMARRRWYPDRRCGWVVWALLLRL